jgi:hypothetical protein
MQIDTGLMMPNIAGHSIGSRKIRLVVIITTRSKNDGHAVRITKVRCCYAEDFVGIERRIKKAREGMEAKAGTSKEKAGSFLARCPRPCRRAARVWVVLAQFGLPVS